MNPMAPLRVKSISQLKNLVLSVLFMKKRMQSGLDRQILETTKTGCLKEVTENILILHLM